MEFTKTNDIHSIAFPAISAGVYHFLNVNATNIAVQTPLRWKDNNTPMDFCAGERFSLIQRRKF